MNTENHPKKSNLFQKLTAVISWFLKQSLLMKIISMAIVIAIIFAIVIGISSMKVQTFEVNAIASLEKIVNISDLSTYKIRYGGVATSYNKEKPDKIDYYVAYEADIYAGIDFEKIDISLDKQTKTVYIDIPEVVITEAAVDYTSMEIMFKNKKANTVSVNEEAYNLCNEDIRAEQNFQTNLLKSAEENAINLLTALTNPIIEQLGEEYKLEIR